MFATYCLKSDEANGGLDWGEPLIYLQTKAAVQSAVGSSTSQACRRICMRRMQLQPPDCDSDVIGWEGMSACTDQEVCRSPSIVFAASFEHSASKRMSDRIRSIL
jgi:hypothetical protein